MAVHAGDAQWSTASGADNALWISFFSIASTHELLMGLCWFICYMKRWLVSAAVVNMADSR